MGQAETEISVFAHPCGRNKSDVNRYVIPVKMGQIPEGHRYIIAEARIVQLALIRTEMPTVERKHFTAPVRFHGRDIRELRQAASDFYIRKLVLPSRERPVQQLRQTDHAVINPIA
jgi:hypothetical protein